MFGADLSGADCIGTNFRDADLSETILSGTDFTGSDLYGVEMDDAILIATDFRAAQNFSSPGQGCLVCKTFWADGEFFKGLDWLE